jgi:hypothetical protein
MRFYISAVAVGLLAAFLLASMMEVLPAKSQLQCGDKR